MSSPRYMSCVMKISLSAPVPISSAGNYNESSRHTAFAISHCNTNTSSREAIWIHAPTALDAVIGDINRPQTIKTIFSVILSSIYMSKPMKLKWQIYYGDRSERSSLVIFHYSASVCVSVRGFSILFYLVSSDRNTCLDSDGLMKGRNYLFSELPVGARMTRVGVFVFLINKLGFLSRKTSLAMRERLHTSTMHERQFERDECPSGDHSFNPHLSGDRMFVSFDWFNAPEARLSLWHRPMISWGIASWRWHQRAHWIRWCLTS